MDSLGRRARAVIRPDQVFRAYQDRKVNVGCLELVSRACLVILAWTEHQVFLEQRAKLASRVCLDWLGLLALKDFPE